MTENSTIEKHSFQAEVQQLLQLMIHSLYSNKEIFLRELISNASDACDKLRFAALTDETLYENEQELGIWVELDEKKRTIVIRDNGIGMSRDEVVENIGTIARSGTKAFLEKMQQEDAKDSRFIGQFGVGFYSSFLVSTDVTLLTRRAGLDSADGVKWRSDGSGEYTLETVEKAQRGTEIIIKLTKEQAEFAQQFRVQSIISKYSDHISLPIYMQQQENEQAENEQAENEQQDKDAVENAWQAVNQGSALWTRSKKEVGEQEYNDFYTSLTYDSQPPAVTLHNHVEGKLEYVSLFYIPTKAPYDLWDREQRNGVKLYVRRIFITDHAKQLLPNYLRFVRGLVDCADLPLNVSREILQDNKSIDKIRAASVKKILGELKKLASKDGEKYANLWREYGRVLKEGVIEDTDNKDELAKILRFASTHADNNEQTVSLDDYVSRMPEQQKAIYYVTADSYESAVSSPHLEVFRKKGIEVLLLSDPVDEWLVSHLTQYNEKPLQSIAKGDLDLDDAKAEDNEAKQKHKESMQPLLEKVKEALGERVKDVRLSDRLVDSPACLVSDEFDLGGNMQRILQSMGQEAPQAKPILEINGEHDIVKRMSKADQLEDWALLLLDQAALAEGAQLKNPGDFVKRMNRLLVS